MVSCDSARTRAQMTRWRLNKADFSARRVPRRRSRDRGGRASPSCVEFFVLAVGWAAWCAGLDLVRVFPPLYPIRRDARQMDLFGTFPIRGQLFGIEGKKHQRQTSRQQHVTCSKYFSFPKFDADVFGTPFVIAPNRSIWMSPIEQSCAAGPCKFSHT
jgi:hypothetical protein